MDFLSRKHHCVRYLLWVGLEQFRATSAGQFADRQHGSLWRWTVRTNAGVGGNLYQALQRLA